MKPGVSSYHEYFLSSPKDQAKLLQSPTQTAVHVHSSTGSTNRIVLTNVTHAHTRTDIRRVVKKKILRIRSLTENVKEIDSDCRPGHDNVRPVC